MIDLEFVMAFRTGMDSAYAGTMTRERGEGVFVMDARDPISVAYAGFPEIIESIRREPETALLEAIIVRLGDVATVGATAVAGS